MAAWVSKLLPPGIFSGLNYASVAGILTIWAAAFLLPVSFAQAHNGKPAELQVGLVAAPPFAMKTADSGWEGLSIDLWRAVASALSARYEMREYGTFGELVDAAANGKLDIVIGLAATEQREVILDLTHPYYRSGLAIAVPRNGAGSVWLGFLRHIQIGRMVSVLAVLIFLWLIAGAAVLLFERERNRDMFGGETLKGLGHAVWWAAVTMTTVGYGDKAPKTLGGRIVAIVWMFASIVLIVGFTGTISASLTAEKLAGKVRGLRDLYYVRVGSVTQSQPLKWLVDQGIAPAPFATAQEGLQAIVDDKIDAFVFDEAVLRYTVKNDSSGLVHVLAETFEHYYLCMGLPHGSPLREQINRALLRIIETDRWKRLVERYIGSGG